MPELTREQSIDQSIEIWEEMVARGGGNEKVKKEVCEEKFGVYLCGCPLCEFTSDRENFHCEKCPYAIEFSDCDHNGYHSWTGGSVNRLEWAKKFLGELYYLKHHPIPEPKSKEWKDVTTECTLAIEGKGGEAGNFITLCHASNAIAFFGTECNSNTYALSGYKLETTTHSCTIYTSGSFRVFKEV